MRNLDGGRSWCAIDEGKFSKTASFTNSTHILSIHIDLHNITLPTLVSLLIINFTKTINKETCNWMHACNYRVYITKSDNSAHKHGHNDEIQW